MGTDNPKLWRPVAVVGVAKLRGVEKVEELRPELQTHSVLEAERSVLEDCDMEVCQPVGSQVRQGAANVSKGEGGWLDKASGVKPHVDPAIVRYRSANHAVHECLRPTTNGHNAKQPNKKQTDKSMSPQQP